MSNEFAMNKKNNMKVHMLKEELYDSILNNTPLPSCYTCDLMVGLVHKSMNDLKINKRSN